MSARKLAFVAAIIVLVTVAIAASPSAQSQLAILTGNLQLNGLFVLSVLLPFVFVLLAAFFVTSRNARQRKRDIDEYMRSTLGQSQQPSFAQNLSAGHNDGDYGKSEMPSETEKAPASQLRVIDGGTLISNNAGASSGETKDRLYFQPVINIAGDVISHYDVYFQSNTVGRRSVKFSQLHTKGTNSALAQSQIDIARRALASLPSLFLASQMPRPNIMLAISPVLLAHVTLWNSFCDLLANHQSLLPDITVMVHIGDGYLADIERLNSGGKALEKLAKFDIQIGLTCSPEMLDRVADPIVSIINIWRTPLASISQQTKTTKNATLKLYCSGVHSESDIVDGLAVGATFMSGNHFGKPRALRGGNGASSQQALMSNAS